MYASLVSLLLTYFGVCVFVPQSSLPPPLFQNGQAETGTAIAAYLVYAKLFPKAHDAVRFFCQKRMTGGVSVLHPSQSRYLSAYAYKYICVCSCLVKEIG